MSELANNVLGDLEDLGYAYLPDFVGFLEYKEKVLSLLSAIAEPLKVYRKHPFWKELPADTTRPRTRSGGVGLNSLHIDLVNLDNPPDLIAFYCVRNDPAGGGRTLASSFDGLEHVVPTDILDELRRPIYRDGAAFDLDGVGLEYNPFPIYDPTADWEWRYSGRILETIKEQSPAVSYEALVEFDRILMNRAIGIDLKPKDLMIVDQRRTLHGRLPMGPNQEDYSLAQRRLVVQAYGRR